LATLAPSSQFLESALKRCDECDHGLLRELSLGTLRWLRRLDQVIATASNRQFDAIEPALRTPLRIGTYQLLFLDRVPAHAAVDEAVEHARRLTHRGGASFTNAVLRRIAREPRLAAWPVEESDPVKRLAIEHSHPDFLVARWLDRLGEPRTRALLAANNRPKTLQLLAFRDRGGRELLAETLIDQGITVEPSALAPLGLLVRHGNPLHCESFRRGELYLQDEASQAAALIPPIRPGERVLDAAAAPGGKSFTIVSAEPTARPLLADVSLARLSTLRANLRRLDRQLPVMVADAGRLPLLGEFDRVILDLPCSGTGTLRKCPELKWRISEEEIGRLSRQALRMMAGTAPRVSVGGYLVAITCSLEPEENEEVVRKFCDRHPEFSLLPLEDLLDPPLTRWILGPGAWRILPEGVHDGFTVHVLVRRQGKG
jgi:16S rRNA (cytosine967-C5)-methyltransferase